MKFFTDFLTNRENSEKRDLAFLLSVFGVAFFQFLGRVPLIEPDEGRYAEIPREMLELGDFITPHLNYVKYFEKPPLHYWLNALSFKIFGENAFAARFPGALMGLLTVLITYHMGRRLFGRREGLLAALILGTSIGFIIQARIDITDMTLTCTLSAALAFFIMAAREGESRKGVYYHLFYFFAALAVLTKGLIGIVFPGAIIFLYMLSTRNWRLLKEMRLLTGIPLFLVVCAPWFIMVSLKNPEFPRFFFIREHFERFTTTVHHRKKGIWFFVPVLLGTMLPWSFFIPAAVRGVWRERQSAEGKTRLYLFIWVAFIFLFFSISDSQLEPYILPIFPALALLCALMYIRTRESTSLFLLAVVAAFAVQFRPESIMCLSVIGLAVLFWARGELKRGVFYLAVSLAFILIIPHLVHLYAVRDMGWGSSGPKFSLDFLEGNLRVNALFYLKNVRFPLLYSIFFMLGLLLQGGKQDTWWKTFFIYEKALILVWFFLFWGIFIVFYAGSYDYGADVRFSLLSSIPLALLAGNGTVSVAHLFKRKFNYSNYSNYFLATFIIFAFIPFLPFVRAITQEAWGARADHHFAKEMAQALPQDSIVLTHNPNMFLLWGKNAAQTSLATEHASYFNRFFYRFPGGIYFHYNFWCNVPDKLQNSFCKNILERFDCTLVKSFKEKDYTYELYRIEKLKHED